MPARCWETVSAFSVCTSPAWCTELWAASSEAVLTEGPCVHKPTGSLLLLEPIHARASQSSLTPLRPSGLPLLIPLSHETHTYSRGD